MNIIPRPEHPNPQFQRRDWMNLNGKWSFKIDKSKSGLAKKYYQPQTKFDRTINVPFCPESVLSGIEYKDFMDAVWYSREFTIPEKYSSLRTILHFGAVDYKATVYINGKEVGTHKGGYISFEFDITDYITDGKNVLTVYAEDDTRNPLQPRGKQSEEYYSHGCDYTRTTGIWQTVWLEFVPESRIKGIKIFPNVENCSVDIQAEVIGSGKFEVLALYQERIMGAATVVSDGGFVTAHLDLKEAYLWEVGEGRLYDLELRFNEDKVDSYFGLRDVRLDGQKFLINGKSVFQRLVLDQGFYPDGIYTAPTEEAMIKDIQISLDVGFNGARLHEKIFEPRFLYHCDKMGYIVWGEYPNWGMDSSNPNILFSILPEWIEEIERDFNHPSIIGWCPFNETWDYDGRKQHDETLAVVYNTTKALDRTRPCIDTSGNFHVITDIFDVHDYEQDPKVFKEHYDKLMTEGELFDNHKKRQKYTGGPTFVSEYGGIRWSVNEGEQNAWGYGDAPKNKYEFIERYKGLTDALLDNDQMFGFCYTQLYDVEQEQNGLYTYSRKPKFEASIFRAINSRKAKIEL
ncbi:MAG: glycoside hydrolase family 2 TIM barrel-domain containing protein [Clostridiaceae bacterium]|nr:glycoside hydrolase family 2 TIM barrel-domain containing protein [Clostridiaceae bacterium]MDY5889461.1 glycoside hydrolase family 2 TIM barrel-domain containing protein [Oscillospiraceae bacterium]